MLDKTSLEDKKILVLFNIEFLQVLVEERKINPENIYYIADNELEYLSAIKIFKVQSYKLSDFSVPALKKLIAGLDMKFDVVFSNPPYNSNIDIKILNEIIDIADEFVVVHPSTWVLDVKGKTKLFTNFVTKINRKVESFEFFNGTQFLILDYLFHA
jgi:16S rRNA G966 N2-methylase RsmD